MSRDALIPLGAILGLLYLAGGVAFLFVKNGGPATVGLLVAASFFLYESLRAWRRPTS